MIRSAVRNKLHLIYIVRIPYPLQYNTSTHICIIPINMLHSIHSLRVELIGTVRMKNKRYDFSRTIHSQICTSTKMRRYPNTVELRQDILL